MKKKRERLQSNSITLSKKVDSNSLKTKKMRTSTYALNGNDNGNPVFFELISLAIGVRRNNEQHKQDNKS